MRYLSLALYAEGQSDQSFLQRVIYRSTFEMAQRLSDQPVEIPEAFYRSKWSVDARSRSEKVVSAFVRPIVEGAINVIFVHADGNGDAEGALRDRVNPCCFELRERSADANFACVPIVPVRETEAWALADAAALRAELGTNRSAQDLGLPSRPNEIEALADPKHLLRNARDATARWRSRRVDPDVSIIPAGLGDRLDLRELRRLAAFQDFESRLEAGLKAIWHL